MMEKVEILYVDDEVNNLLGFKANFRLDYIIHIASNTKEAEKILAENPNIRIIFCDQRMPDELGVDFLARVRKEYPRPIRILLTAYADMSVVIDAINRGNIFKFVRKPWINEDIISSIEEANKFYIATSLLDVRNEELQKAYDELDKFAYSISHDLRDPLTGVLSAITYALGYDKVKDIHELLKMMQGSILKLDQYIDSLRDYYLLRRGELLLKDIDFNEVANNLREFYQVSVERTQIDFKVEVDQPTNFKSDISLIELIMHNLLSNAFKYQREGEANKFIHVTIKVAKGIATIEVKDNGIGIPTEAKEEIFKLFYRASNQSQGMGFGLYNVNTALIKIKGTIQVESELGKGTKFTIQIPSK
ncbi:hybrid sensor histidine kinase/response regulator [Sphingobacterium sp. SGL-16]|uniref:histidine kinase n=2 Tax=Sphingobacteriaceae TaxID=84566 RepID=A0ABR7YFR3_9SPHI|nr:hybrid sensor histidine kinase/response regulator [Sphingobacterium litopenaei]NGM72980.1 hybrid sensor histidine kinase/response regulator [Sphingobacterium sp. SGL-16]